MTYFVELDAIDGNTIEGWHDEPSYADIVCWVEHVLDSHEGGHADIYNEEGEFLGDVEI